MIRDWSHLPDDQLPPRTVEFGDGACRSFVVNQHRPYLCTRDSGHAGDHEAGVPHFRIVATWADDDATPYEPTLPDPADLPPIVGSTGDRRPEPPQVADIVDGWVKPGGGA